MWIKKITIFCVFLLGIMYYLSTKYVETGECAIIVYYIPMSWIDYVVITAIGMISILLSYLIQEMKEIKKGYCLKNPSTALLLFINAYSVMKY